MRYSFKRKHEFRVSPKTKDAPVIPIQCPLEDICQTACGCANGAEAMKGNECLVPFDGRSGVGPMALLPGDVGVSMPWIIIGKFRVHAKFHEI